MIAAALPSDFTCSEGARELIHDCCKEFVQLLASEANEMTNSSEGGRGRINAAHLVGALKELGYERYLPDVDEIVEGEKADAKVRSTRVVAMSREWCCSCSKEDGNRARRSFDAHILFFCLARSAFCPRA